MCCDNNQRWYSAIIFSDSGHSKRVRVIAGNAVEWWARWGEFGGGLVSGEWSEVVGSALWCGNTSPLHKHARAHARNLPCPTLITHLNELDVRPNVDPSRSNATVVWWSCR